VRTDFRVFNRKGRKEGKGLSKQGLEGTLRRSEKLEQMLVQMFVQIYTLSAPFYATLLLRIAPLKRCCTLKTDH
jgi:hypothetical protein